MGKVYRVEDKKIKGEIALKLIKPEIASDKKIIERFNNELKMARMISHRNVCRMFDLGEEKGAHYITMEYVRGEDLKSMIRMSGQLGVGTTINIAKQVCEGLAEAHRLGVVHRDLKPQNIMIDKEGNVRIMDFGIARSLKAKGITGAGVIIGTPEYMSPEQVEGKEAGQRSDIYSLGVILYEMVTGRVPFEGDTPLSVAIKQKTETPEDPRKLNSQIPEDLSRVLLRCMEKDKEKRYQSSGEVLSELEKIKKGIPTTEKVIQKRKPITSKEITVTFGLKKLFVPTLVVIVLLIVAVLFWQPWSQKETVPITSDRPLLAIMYFKNNTGDEKLDNLRNAFSDLLITDLIKSKYLKVLSGDKLLNILRQLNLQEAKSYSSEDLKQVAVSGGATHILQGNYIKIAETYRIDIWLYETSTMELIDTETEQGKEENFYWMVNELTKKIKANFKLSEEEIAGDIDMASESADEDFAKGAVRAIRDIKPPKLIKSVPPIYPEKARQARVEGTVIVEARTNAQGNVEALRIIRSIPLLDQAAIDAVKQWKYEPKIIEGKARSIVFTVTVMFRLKKSKKENLAHSGQNI
jgi:TonB family protein